MRCRYYPFLFPTLVSLWRFRSILLQFRRNQSIEWSFKDKYNFIRPRFNIRRQGFHDLFPRFRPIHHIKHTTLPRQRPRKRPQSRPNPIPLRQSQCKLRSVAQDIPGLFSPGPSLGHDGESAGGSDVQGKRDFVPDDDQFRRDG